MQPRIRIIRRGADANPIDLVTNQLGKSDRELERETANKVKSWVAEWKARNRLVQAAAFSLVGSLDSRQKLDATVRIVNG
jgi:hypothetical protein